MHIFERKANYYETDQMGIVHHSNYIRWFEEARLDLMDRIGLSYRAIEEAGVLIPVLDVTCAYKQPIHFDETIILELNILNYTGTRFAVSYTGRSKETGHVCCTGMTHHCFTTKDLKPLRLQRQHPEWHAIFERESRPETEGTA